MNKRLLFLVCVFFMSHIATAGELLLIDNEPVEITGISTSGTGCPSNSVVPSLTSDNTQVALLFNAYRIITTNDPAVIPRDCTIEISLAVPEGLAVGVVGIDWRGTVVAGSGAKIKFHRKYSYSGKNGRTANKQWVRPGLYNFFLEDYPLQAHYSSCKGEPLTIRIDTSATVDGPSSLFTLRSADFESKLTLSLDVDDQRCKKRRLDGGAT